MHFPVKDSNIGNLAEHRAFRALAVKILARWKELSIEQARDKLSFNLFEIFREKFPEKFEGLTKTTHEIYFQWNSSNTTENNSAPAGTNVRTGTKRVIQPGLFDYVEN